ncbi:MAG: bifunctional phosphoribosylaminoimidazolecarboxamide formyltransferase/IMP cyclohydrolase, partial [Candidatus Aminicenantes bacterium]|nr:bifunctional phosphoribosylaminoimidazolecarboxamide formyltransferase/IMP cyclohydrolase [Candidatus Aminicenantes bacterium]
MKLALISVYHKEGIEEVAKKLRDNGWQIISTGGTATHIKEHDIDVIEVSDLTQFPEILDGRVKTLHPMIFGPILAKKSQKHLEQLKQLDTSKIDLVIVNFYPFEEALTQRDKGIDYMVENIDIGGPSMVRAAAKNFENTIVIFDNRDYLPIVEQLITKGDIPLDLRKKLAQKTFAYCSLYDSLIARYLHEGQTLFPDYYTRAGRKNLDLRYGENPHQQAAMYISDKNSSLANFEKIQGKELSFNNILDLSMVYEVLNQFMNDGNFSLIVKHQNPCGAALGISQPEAFKNAFSADSKSAFGGIVGFNKPLQKETAEELGNIFFEAIIAPDFSEEALNRLKKKKNLRIIKMKPGYFEDTDIKTIPGGFLLQQKDIQSKDVNQFELKTSRSLKKNEKDDVAFGWKLIKYVKSNGIILVKDQMLIG